MDGALKIFQSISSTDLSNLKIYLNALNEHQTFRHSIFSPTDTAVQHVTSLLGKCETRSNGLLILASMLNQCSLSVIEQKGNIWATLCLKVCQQKDNDDLSVSYGYDVLSILLEKSADIPELTKSFSSNLVGKICETMAYCTPNAQLSALKCLEKCLKMFSSQCGGHLRAILEKFLLNFIDSNDDNLILWSGKCYHLLQQVKQMGVQNVNQRTAWQNYQLSLLGSLHKILDIIYSSCPELYDDEIEIQELQLPLIDLNKEPVERAARLIQRLKNLMQFLIIAIREPFPVSKNVMPKNILNLISRGLAVNCQTMSKNPINDNIAIGILLPELHIEFFKLLDVMILILKSNLATYYKNILDFVMNTLKWTSSGKSRGFSKPYGTLRSAAYKTLILWCKIMKFGSCTELIYEYISEQIDNDITPFQSEMTLQVLSGSRKHLTKKARRKLHKAQNEKSHLAQVHSKSTDIQNAKLISSDYENNMLCCVALQALKEMLTYCSNFLKPIAFKTISEKIIQISIHLSEMFSSEITGSMNSLFSSSLSRCNLYEVLYCLVSATHPLCPPPTDLVIHLLAQAQINDKDSSVREICSRNLQSLEKILHPQKECLYFPLNYAKLRKALTQGRCENQELCNDDSYSDEDLEVTSNEINLPESSETVINRPQIDQINLLQESDKTEVFESIENNRVNINSFVEQPQQDLDSEIIQRLSNEVIDTNEKSVVEIISNKNNSTVINKDNDVICKALKRNLEYPLEDLSPVKKKLSDGMNLSFQKLENQPDIHTTENNSEIFTNDGLNEIELADNIFATFVNKLAEN